jgi:type I restriction enzyme S subunit
MVPLGELAELVRRAVEVDVDGLYPELGVRSFGRGTFHKPPLTGADAGSKRLFRIETGDLVFNIVFAWEGAVAVAGREDNGRFGSHRFLTFVPDPNRAESGFIKAWFSTPAGLEILGRASPGGAGRNRTLGVEAAKRMPVPLPPLEVQRQIVARLDSVEVRIAKRRSEAEAVDEELAALLAAAFRRIAENAPRARMADVAPLVRRSVMIDPEASYTEIGVRSFFKGAFHRRTVSGAEFTWQKLFRINEGDLIFSNLMAWEKGIALAGAADDGCVGNHRMLTCEADRSRLVPGFLWFYFTTDEGFAQVVAASPGTIARNKTLSAEELPNIKVPVPSLDAQRWFDALQQKARAAREAQAAAAAELDHLVPALLAEAFGSG